MEDSNARNILLTQHIIYSEPIISSQQLFTIIFFLPPKNYLSLTLGFEDSSSHYASFSRRVRTFFLTPDDDP